MIKNTWLGQVLERRRSLIALTSAAVLLVPLFGCTPAANPRDQANRGARTQGIHNKGARTTNVQTYTSRPDIAQHVRRRVPDISSAIVLVRDHTAYVAVHAARSGPPGRHVTERPPVGGAIQGIGTTGTGYNGTAVTGYNGYPGATSGVQIRPGTGGNISGSGAGGATGNVGSGTTGAGGPGGGSNGAGMTGAGGIAGGTGGGGRTGVRTDTSNNPAGAAAIHGVSDITEDLRARVVQAVREADPSISNVYVSNNRTLMSRFQTFVSGRGTQTRFVVNELGDVIRLVFPTAR